MMKALQPLLDRIHIYGIGLEAIIELMLKAVSGNTPILLMHKVETTYPDYEDPFIVDHYPL